MKALACLALAVLTLSSCNTMIGMGRDFRQLGEGIENKASGRSFDGSDPQQQENVPTY